MLKKILGFLVEQKLKIGEPVRRTNLNRQKIVSEQAREEIKRIRAKGLSLPIFTL